MKTFIILCSLVALTLGKSLPSDEHQVQHQQSVAAARQKLQESLSKLGVQGGQQGSSYGNSYGSSGSQRYVAGCSTCYDGSDNRASSSYTSRTSSSSNSQQRNVQGVDSDYSGVGIVGHSGDRYSAHDDDDVQSRVEPSYAGSSLNSRYSSQSANEADDMQQRVVPGDLSGVQSSAYRSRGSEREHDDQQRTVSHGYTPVYGGSRTSTSSRDESNSESSRTFYGSEGAQGQNRGSGQVVNLAVRPGTSTVLAVPIRVIQTTGTADDQQRFTSRTSEHSSGSESSSNTRSQYPSSTTYRVVYTPSINSVASDKIASTYQSESSRTSSGVQQPEKLINYNSYAPGSSSSSSSSQSRFNQEERNSDNNQVRVSPSSVSYPSNGGSSRVAYGSQSGSSSNRVVVAPVNTFESSRTAEERDDRHYKPASPTYISSSRNSNSEFGESRNQVVGSRPAYVSSSDRTSGSSQQTSSQHGNSGTTYYYPSRTQTQSQQQTAIGSQNRQQSAYNSGRTQNSQSDYVSQRFGSGVSHLNTDNLNEYMSESERLARLQQGQISSSSRGSSLSNSEANRQTIQSASALDSAAANFIQNSQVGSRFNDLDAASLNNAGTGGFNHVRSWNKQSKWSSGSEYGPDGKPKTYSTLVTGEAEKHKVNGEETGYQAATTTLENDGKVSTYSIHT